MRCSSCSENLKPVAVFDIDGTLAQYHRAFSYFTSRYFDRTLPLIDGWDGSGEMEDFLGLTKAEYREAKLAYRQGGQKRFIPMYEHADVVVQSVAALGIEIWVATTRPWQRLDNIDPDTKEWLRRNQIPCDGLLFGDDKYEMLLDQIDAGRILLVVDDLPEQLEKASKLGLPYFQVERPHNSGEMSLWDPRGSLGQAFNLIANRKVEWDAR